MSFFVLQIKPSSEIPEDHPVRALTDNLDEYLGAFIVDSHIDPKEVTLTLDALGRARRFSTAQLAYTFSTLGGLKDVPVNILRIDGHGGA